MVTFMPLSLVMTAPARVVPVAADRADILKLKRLGLSSIVLVEKTSVDLINRLWSTKPSFAYAATPVTCQ